MKLRLSLIIGVSVALLGLAQPARGQTLPPSASPTPTATATAIPPPIPHIKQVQILRQINGQWKPTGVLFLHDTYRLGQPDAGSARFRALWSTSGNASGTVHLTKGGKISWSGDDGTAYPVSARLRLSRQGKTFYRTAMTGKRSGKSVFFFAPVTFHDPAWDGPLTASVTITLGPNSATRSHRLVLAGPARLIISNCMLPSQSPCHVSIAGRGFSPHEVIRLYRRITLLLDPRGTQPAQIHCQTPRPDGCDHATSDGSGSFGARSFWYTAPRCTYGVTFTYWAIGKMGDRDETPTTSAQGDPGPSGCTS
jgi:hypothetical protein